MSAPFRTVKSDVVGSGGVVATNHPLASAAAIEALADGANAVDAAVSALFALTVVEPMMVGLCGAGFFVHRLPDGTTVTLDNYATVPAAAHPELFEPIPHDLEYGTVGDRNNTGHLAVATPGALAGWAEMLARHGTMSLADAVAAAIRYAERGFTASPYLSQAVAESPRLAEFAAAAGTFHPGGRPLRPGDRLRQPDAAATLRAVAEAGPDVLYRGPLGAALVAEMEHGGGLVTAADLAGYRVRWREPVRGEYRGCSVTSMPPASSGGTHVIEILNLLEGFDVAGLGFGTVAGVHLFVEALKLAFADRTEFMADPETTDVPVAWLTSKAYAAGRRADLDPARASSFAAGRAGGGGDGGGGDGEGACTTHVTVLDGAGGIVSTTQTINALFGSKVMASGTGMVLNNCMGLMDPTPGRTNSIAAGKRILSSMSPTIVGREGRPWFALGTPGGNRIFAAVTQAILNVVDHGMSLQEAVEAPRVWTMGGAVHVEDTFPGLTELVAGLERLGHRVEVVPKVAGGMNGVMIDDDGRRRGAACWRADGAPMAMSGGAARETTSTLDR